MCIDIQLSLPQLNSPEIISILPLLYKGYSEIKLADVLDLVFSFHHYFKLSYLYVHTLCAGGPWFESDHSSFFFFFRIPVALI